VAWRSDLLQKLPTFVSMPLRSRYGYSREPEMKALHRFIGRGGHCVDIGCHLGIYAHAFMRLGGASTIVTGIEPQPILGDYLERSFRARIRRGQFRLIRTAVGAEESIANLAMPLENGKVNRGRASLNLVGGATEAIQVPVVTLDSLNLSRVTFIKCDVEGFEFPVLLGGRKLLARDMPTLLVEIEEQHAHERVQATFDLLIGLNYAAVVFRPADKKLAVITGSGDIPRRAAEWVGHYVYNYFFVAPATLAELEISSA
jgi:FkbM family methyltransferase